VIQDDKGILSIMAQDDAVGEIDELLQSLAYLHRHEQQVVEAAELFWQETD
jgi:hypothetical protein